MIVLLCAALANSAGAIEGDRVMPPPERSAVEAMAQAVGEPLGKCCMDEAKQGVVDIRPCGPESSYVPSLVDIRFRAVAPCFEVRELAVSAGDLRETPLRPPIG